MLKSPSLNRSQASPTLFNHYAPTSTRPSLSRRTSTANKPSPSPQPQPKKWAGVDKATQWSPMLNSKTDNASAAPMQVRAGDIPIQPSDAPEENASHEVSQETKPPLQADSPSMKRRQSESENTNATNKKPSPPKRPKPARKPVKILPARYEFCEVEDLVILIASMMTELIQTNDELPLRTGVLTRFHSRSPPGISVLDYLQRLAKHATLTPPILLSMVYYCDRLCSLYPAFTITTLTVHRFLITAATVAAKGLSDSFWNNKTYARVGGVKLAELGMLELDFLYRVDWKIVPNPEVLVEYYKGLIDRSEDYQLEGTKKRETHESDDEDKDEGSEISDTLEKHVEVAADVRPKT